MGAIAKACGKGSSLTAANRINEAHRSAINAVAKAAQTGMERIIEVGRLLTEENEKHAHGKWIAWVEDNLDFGRKQAWAYMRAYENRDQLLSNVSRVETFGLERAMKLLAKPREKPVKRRESPDASVEIEDSDEDDDQNEDSFGADASDDDSYMAAYLLRADQAIRFAVYRGNASKDVIAMARRVADAWSTLADELENDQ